MPDSIHTRVYNGYGMKTSKLSVTNIGMYNIEAAAISRREAQQKAELLRAAMDEGLRGKADHPSKRNLHFQKEYPETMQRLAKGDLTRVKTPNMLKTFGDPGPQLQTSNIDMATTRKTVAESTWNDRKREYNKSKSSRAEVNRIMCGSTELKQPERIFPQKATHQQLLGIDNKLVGTSVDKPAPPVDRRLRWLGDDKGWENNRGLKAEHPSFEDGKSEAWPNPKNWNKNPGPLWA